MVTVMTDASVRRPREIRNGGFSGKISFVASICKVVRDTRPAGTYQTISRLNGNPAEAVSASTMTKLIALVAAGAFAAGTMFEGEHGDCTKKAGNEGKMACTA